MSRILARASLVALFGGALAWACTSFSETSPSSSDGGASDASFVDASSDGGPSGPGARFCDTVDASFCWSFDEEPFIAGGPLLTAPGGGLSLTDAALSPPYALRAVRQGSATVAAAAAGEYVSYVPPVTNLHCEAWVRIEKMDSPDGGTNDMAPVAFGGTQETGYFDFKTTPSGTLVASLIDVPSPDAGIDPALATTTNLGQTAWDTNEWHHVVMEFGQTKIVASLDSKPAATVPRLAPGSPLTVVSFGSQCSVAGNCQVSFENLFCRPASGAD
jgi:hypothetical protein